MPMDDQLPTPVTPVGRLLTAAEFQGLAEVPPEIEWFNNITNRGTRRVYKNTIRDFMRFTGIVRPEEFRVVTRAHVIAWRDDLERRGLEGPTRRNRMAALSSLFEYLCEKNAVTHNPVKGVKRPKADSGEGTTPTIGDHQARQLLAAPTKETSRPNATARSYRHCFTTRCVAKSSASSRLRISGTRAAACRTSKSKARARRRAFCRCIPAPTR
jgi:integrase/recombinase XerD